MFEQDLLDEEIKKKKRRVLVVLLVLLLGTGMTLPIVDLATSPVAAVPGVTEAPTRTVVPTKSPAPPARESTEEATLTTTPRPTATATHTPVVPTMTEESLGGDGGEKPDASPAPTAVPKSAFPTPEESELLPATGTDAGESGRLALGLVAILMGLLLLMTSFALWPQH